VKIIEVDTFVLSDIVQGNLRKHFPTFWCVFVTEICLSCNTGVFFGNGWLWCTWQGQVSIATFGVYCSTFI